MARLITKNWVDFQHYKDRAPPWIKLHKHLIDDFEFQCLPVASRALAPMLWLLASEEMDGSIDYNVKKIAFRLRMTEVDFVDAAKPLINSGFFVLVSDCADCASELLAECLSREETETETETEEELTSTDVEVVASESLPTCPHQEIISAYAEILPELPQPRVWDGQRKDALAARWKWVIADLRRKGKPCDRSDGIDFFRRMFEYISRSDHLMGRKGDWTCSLPWIVKAENFAKIIEGNYENKVQA